MRPLRGGECDGDAGDMWHKFYGPADRAASSPTCNYLRAVSPPPG